MGFAEYPFRSRYLEVTGSRIHYIDEGTGPTLLFLHGNPTSSYLWRNVIKPLRERYRCIAPDLIGFGQSDRPDIDYRFPTHYRYIEGLVEALGLQDVTLVLHDWGGPLGFRLAQQQPERVRALCFMETFPFTMGWDELPLAARPLFRAFRNETLGRFLVMRQNLFINLMIPFGVVRSLPRSVMAAYRAPFRNWRDRYPILVWPNELPLNDERKGETWRMIRQIEDNLSEMAQPMLLLTFRPGALIPAVRARWLQARIPDLEITECGRGLHYVQEDQPRRIAGALGEWLKRRGLYSGRSRDSHKDSSGKARQGDTARSTPAALACVHESDSLNGTLHWYVQGRNDETLLTAWSDRGMVLRVWLDAGQEPESVLHKEFPRATPEATKNPPRDPDDASQPVHLVGTAFQRRVWKALREIPAGTTLSYRDLAERLNTAPRALGQAVGRNRVAELVPCHRIIPADGGIGNYRWGKARKQALLEQEAPSGPGHRPSEVSDRKS